MRKLSSHIVAATLLVAVALCPVAAKADNTALYVGSCTAGSGGCTLLAGAPALSASALFDLNSTTNMLTITLTNTYAGDAKDATAILGALLFNSSGLTPVSASLNGSTVYGSFVKNVGEGWQYKSSISMDGANSGISAVGYGVFGPKGNFYKTGQLLQGSNYGIAPVGYTNTGNPSIKDPIIQNSLQFTLKTPSGFSLSNLGTVVFQYGTSLGEPSFTGTLHPVPEPPVTMLLACSALLFGGVLRRFRCLF